MQFLLLTQYFPPEIGAAPVRLAELSRALRNQGHTVTVVTAMPNYPTGRVFPDYRGKFLMRDRVDGQAVIRTWIYAATGTSSLQRLASYWSFTFSAFIGCWLAPRPDFLVVESPPIFLGLTAYLFSVLTGCRYIVNVSDPWLEFARALGFIRSQRVFTLFERLELFLYRHAFKVNAVTRSIHTLLIERKAQPPEKVLWLPNGVNLERFRPCEPDAAWRERLGIADEAVFIYAGSHQMSHGLHVVIEAAGLLNCSARLLLVGDGTDKARLVQCAHRRGLRNVQFVDPQPIDEIPRLLSLARAALVVIRDAEAFSGSRPAKMFPAMACGLPLIYSGRGEGAELVQEMECGLVVPPGDPVALAAAITHLATDPELARRLGSNGRHFVEHSSSWNSIVRHWLLQV
jgi:colanic acid biosynthesis glycosyl transferase WcaI